jgi:predicted ATP-grasp superfamily ATP-dependent carboligase
VFDRKRPSSAKAALKTILALWALFIALPFNLALVGTALVYGLVAERFDASERRRTARERKTVLVSGGKMTKALQLARSFHQAGHRVILVESNKYWFTGHRFSRAVSRFYTVPKPDSPTYPNALLEIVKRERVDLYVPVSSPVSSLYDSQAMPLLSPHCDVMHVGPSQIELLDDKLQFSQIAETLGLAVPKSFLITDPEEVVHFDFSRERRSYIIKSIAYDSIRRLDLTRLPARTSEETAAFARSLPISKSNPWIMQEFIPGQEYCTHGTLRDGELRVHCCCESSAFQINYDNVDKPEIEAWIKTFGAGLGITGQASFDFIEADDDGTVYAIECNPRTHSAITMFYGDPRIAAAYLDTAASDAPIRPLTGSRPTYWIYHEIWRLLTQVRSGRIVIDRLRTIARGRDAVFDWRDPLPFLMLHHVHVPLLLARDLFERRGWVRIDFNIGKLVQLGGD